MNPLVVVERVHWCLSASEKNGTVIIDFELADGSRAFDQPEVFWRADESQAYKIIRGIPAFIPRIAPAIGLKSAAIWAVDIDFVATFCKFPVRMCYLAPPETDGPTGLLRQRRIGGDDGYLLGLLRIEDVDRSAHKTFLSGEIPSPLMNQLTVTCWPFSYQPHRRLQRSPLVRNAASLRCSR